MKKLTELSLEELKKKRGTLELATGLMTGLVFVMVIVGVLDYFNSKSFNFTQILALFFIPILIINYMTLKKIKTEIQSRS